MEENGVWRTVGGRRIFIKEGQDLASAMKESGKFDNKPKYTTKQEVNKRIKEINKKIYSGVEVEKEEYDKLKKELENELSGIENYEDEYGIDGQIIDETDTEITKKISEMYENGEIDDIEYENYLDERENVINNIMREKGYEWYMHRNQYYYSMIPKAKKAYDNIIEELDKRDVNYEISKSWNPGELPSIYVKDDEGNQFRIANHYNSKNQQFDAYSMKENKIYSTRDYINYEKTVLKDLDEFLGEGAYDKYLDEHPNSKMTFTKFMNEIYRKDKK